MLKSSGGLQGLIVDLRAAAIRLDPQERRPLPFAGAEKRLEGAHAPQQHGGDRVEDAALPVVVVPAC